MVVALENHRVGISEIAETLSISCGLTRPIVFLQTKKKNGEEVTRKMFAKVASPNA